MMQILTERLHKYLKEERHPDFLKKAESLENADEATLNEHFGAELAFGTGGLRGLIGPGTNRINPFVVRRAGQGVADYVKSVKPGAKLRCVISYDSRHYSQLFAYESALLFAANDIEVFLSDRLRPVPLLSFGVRHFRADFGIMITASHNPAAYNGYKVYWSDGAQVLPPHDNGIIKAVGAVGAIRQTTEKEALDKGLLHYIGYELDEAYSGLVRQLFLHRELEKKHFIISYTPLHGSGYYPVTENLQKAGFTVIVPEAQREPDGNFPTVRVPNPEFAETLTQAINLAQSHRAPLVLATDPDADRLGAAVFVNESYRLLSGNQIGALLLDYICAGRQQAGSLPADGYFVNTIVTSALQNSIAGFYGLKSYRVLTGFKYIGEVIEKQRGTFIFGCEESFGYLVTPEIRDKDAVSAALLMAEMALYYGNVGKTLFDRLEELYRQFGYFAESQLTHEYPGLRGKEAMKKFMDKLRADKAMLWNGDPAEKIYDYEQSVVYSGNGQTSVLSLPASNVLQFETAEGKALITVRPSGTEPKIKFYIQVKDDSREAVHNKLVQLENQVRGLLENS
jgi:phosphoglucomutase